MRSQIVPGLPVSVLPSSRRKLSLNTIHKLYKGLGIPAEILIRESQPAVINLTRIPGDVYTHARASGAWLNKPSMVGTPPRACTHQRQTIADFAKRGIARPGRKLAFRQLDAICIILLAVDFPLPPAEPILNGRFSNNRW